MNSIILLSGPVGAGKSAVAQQMVRLSTGPVANIEGDKFWSFIAKDAAEGITGRKKNFRIIMASMVAAAVPYAANGYDVILDFSIPPWFIDTARKIAKVRDIPLHYVVLRPSEMVCAIRAASRAEGAIRDYTPYQELYASFEGSRPYMISDDEGSPVVLARRIWKGVLDGDFSIE